MNTTTVCRRRPFQVQRNLSDESLPIRRYQLSVPATVLEALTARLVVRSERHWIRDTNHTVADRPCAACSQGNRDAEATISNSSLERDHRQHGGDESIFGHAHVRLANHDLRFLEQETEQKMQEIRTTNGQLPTKTCGAEEDGGHEQNRSFTNLRIIATGYSLSLALMSVFPHLFMISLPRMMFQQIVFSFRKTARVTCSHNQLSTTTFLLSSTITQLDRRPAGTLCRPSPTNVTTKLQDCCRILEKNRRICLVRRLQRFALFGCALIGGENHAFRGRFSEKRRSFSRVCASWFPKPCERNKEDEEIPRCCMASVRQGADFDKVTSIDDCRVQH